MPPSGRILCTVSAPTIDRLSNALLHLAVKPQRFPAGSVLPVLRSPCRSRPSSSFCWCGAANRSRRDGSGSGFLGDRTRHRNHHRMVLAGVGGASFGPSTIGAVTAASAGRPNWCLTAFLVALVPGATFGARTSGGWRMRGETVTRYVQLAVGGILIGAGGLIAGGCNLGHGVSGVAQLGISSFVMVAGMIGGVALAAAVRERIAETSEGLATQRTPDVSRVTIRRSLVPVVGPAMRRLVPT